MNTIVIFGASGDLTRRKLGPALYNLHAKGRLPIDTRVVAFSRTAWDDDAFRSWLGDGIEEFSDRFDAALWTTFAPRLHYQIGDLESAESFTGLHHRLATLEGGPAHRLYYLAIAPQLVPTAVAHLGHAGMATENGSMRRLVIEKPFGRDLATAVRLNQCVQAVFAEHQVFRIDHYLGKETAQNLLYFRFANTIFEPIWNRNFIDNVQITVAETVDVGRRGGYYDQAGVLRDMFQSHLLQLFTLVAMEPPAPYNATTLRNEKVKVLSATRPVALDDMIYAQYDGYLDAPGVKPDSCTPTYAAACLSIDNWRWQGVPFFLRSGKVLATKTSEIAIEFKRPPYQMFGAFQTPNPNVLSICIQPDEGVHLQIDAKVPDQPQETRPVNLEFHYRTSFRSEDLPEAYERLLLDTLNGDGSLFARSDEIEHAWRIIDPLIRECEGDARGRLVRYAPRSWGPAEADAMLNRHDRRWHSTCGGHD